MLKYYWYRFVFTILFNRLTRNINKNTSIYKWCDSTFIPDYNEITIKYEVNRHRNELVIDVGGEIVKLIGFTNEFDDDMYYVYARASPTQLPAVYLSSCVGCYFLLKGRLPSKEYSTILNTFNLNEFNLENIEDELHKQNVKHLE